PDAVFSGHVHNYQRFTREINGRQIPFIVAGAGGYADRPSLIHKLQLDSDGQPIPQDKPFRTTAEGVTLEFYEETNPGFLRFTVAAEPLTGESSTVPFDDAPPAAPVDTFRLNWKTSHRLEAPSGGSASTGRSREPRGRTRTQQAWPPVIRRSRDRAANG